MEIKIRYNGERDGIGHKLFHQLWGQLRLWPHYPSMTVAEFVRRRLIRQFDRAIGSHIHRLRSSGLIPCMKELDHGD